MVSGNPLILVIPGDGLQEMPVARLPWLRQDIVETGGGSSWEVVQGDV